MIEKKVLEFTESENFFVGASTSESKLKKIKKKNNKEKMKTRNLLRKLLKGKRVLSKDGKVETETSLIHKMKKLDFYDEFLSNLKVFSVK